jgi:hypothetical protein
MSGIVLVTDGGQNAGAPPEAGVEMAAEAKIAIYPVGVGSTKRPINVRVYELEAPERAHPGDPYTVTGLIQGEGIAGQTVTVQLILRDPEKKTEQPVQTQQVLLAKDGDTASVKFQVTPTETGRRQLVLRVTPPRGDRNPNDDFRESDIEIVDRKNRVLLIAGAGSREYQFLKTLLYRDKSTIVDVYLQTGVEGISQEANEVLTEFPSTREQMYAYDCVVAFDPNWLHLSAEQVDLLETWVAEQGGGLIVIPGPVYAGQPINGWIQDNGQPMAKIKALYPVEFHRRVSVVDAAAYGAKDPWPLDFTREGQEAEFLGLTETESERDQAWSRFTGVYGHFPVKGAKPGATVYARFSDPQSAENGQQPAYLAGQFYGSGRVFYLGSGEMWRLRRAEETFFDQFYTRLIRHVTQGRLLRQSNRGSLMVDKARYILSNTVQIRAQLMTPQLQPLNVPSVPLDVVLEGGGVQTIALRPDPSRVGMYLGQFPALREGTYRLELNLEGNERLIRRIQVFPPRLEADNPQRNDPLLSRVANGSGGKYYDDLSAAFAADSPDSLLKQLKDKTKTSVLTSAPNPDRQRQWLTWMMGILCGVLCVEWLIRRLSKLA